MDEASDQSDCRLKKKRRSQSILFNWSQSHGQEKYGGGKYSLLKSDHKKHRLGKRSTACTFHTEGQVMTHW